MTTSLTAFQYAAAQKNEATTALLIENGADVYSALPRGKDSVAGKVVDAIIAQQGELGIKTTAQMVAKVVIAAQP
jgi:hypothetical protein